MTFLKLLLLTTMHFQEPEIGENYMKIQLILAQDRYVIVLRIKIY